MIEGVKKGSNVNKAKKAVAGYKAQYKAYKNRDGTKSYINWASEKSYIKRDKTCCI